MRIIAMFLAGLLLTHQGATQQNCTGCGVAYLRSRIFKPELNAYVLPMYEKDVRHLFYDSTMILERHKIFSNTDRYGKETWRRDVIGYTFVDFRTQTFYDYRHFSDTARVIQATKRPKFWPEGGGSMFFQKNPRPYHATSNLPDTVIDDLKHYRLHGFFLRNSDTTVIETMYYVEETERPMGYLGKVIVDGKQFSYVRLEDINVRNNLRDLFSMDIVSKNLTKRELKVFAAWKRNAATSILNKPTKNKAH